MVPAKRHKLRRMTGRQPMFCPEFLTVLAGLRITGYTLPVTEYLLALPESTSRDPRCRDPRLRYRCCPRA
jgi:hypothetical protein